MRKYNLPIFIPHRGCPHDCAFCNQTKITGVDTDITTDSVRSMIAKFLNTIDSQNSAVEIAFFGGSFTGLELETQETFLKVANEFGSVIDGIRVSTRPDYINREILDLLKKHNVTTVELGVQSSDDEVLRLNNRGHSFGDVVKASKLIREYGISLGHQMMLGMYGSDANKDWRTVCDIVKLKPDCVRIYPVLVLKGTTLEQLYNRGEYAPLEVMTAAQHAKRAVKAFRKHKIDVIRIGLHSSEDLESEGNVVAGPYHQAFGELVESLIYRDRLRFQFLMDGVRDCEYEYTCDKGEVSKVIGHKRMNVEYFAKKFNIRLKVREG